MKKTRNKVGFAKDDPYARLLPWNRHPEYRPNPVTIIRLTWRATCTIKFDMTWRSAKKLLKELVRALILGKTELLS